MEKARPAEGVIEMKLFLVLPCAGCKYLVKEDPRSAILEDFFFLFINVANCIRPSCYIRDY